MKVFATTVIQELMPGVGTYLPTLARLAALDRVGKHRLVEEPGAADIILFLDGHQHYADVKLSIIRDHPLVAKHPGRAFLYSELDQPWCAMPGLYVAMPKRHFDPLRQRACAYISAPNQHVGAAVAPEKADLLFSFMGRKGNALRASILGLKHEAAWIEDTSALNFFDRPTADMEQQKLYYANILGRSKFVLCPRGAGASSYRVFEAMTAGRVPVVLSDAWVPPRGPAWEECALFVPESDVENIPQILETNAHRFAAMAIAARKEWEQWFASEVLFHRMIESLEDLIESWNGAVPPLSRGFDPLYMRLFARALKSNAKRAVKQLMRPEQPVNVKPELASRH